MYDGSSDNSGEISTDVKNLRLFILMISWWKKVLTHCIDKIDIDYNRIKKFNQLVRKRTLKHSSNFFYIKITRLNSLATTAENSKYDQFWNIKNGVFHIDNKFFTYQNLVSRFACNARVIVDTSSNPPVSRLKLL